MSQIASSFYSNNSSNFYNITEFEGISHTKEVFYREAEFLTAELSTTDSNTDLLSDEAFVAKQVLAEQIGRYF